VTESGYRTKKRFGQHFLHERKFIDDILAAAAIGHDERVLEVGPGLGALTEHLLAVARHVEVIELDRDLIERLKNRPRSNLLLHEGDALAFDWPSILLSPPYVFVANLPYNISSQILFKLLDNRSLFSRAVLMFQKEVGDRICAAPATRDYGILSVLCQLYFTVKRVAIVPPGAFRPPPKVESAVISFHRLEQPVVSVDNEAFLRRVVKAAFSQRRKTLRNTLKANRFGSAAVEQACSMNEIDPARRGETLTLVEFVSLTNSLLRLDIE